MAPKTIQHFPIFTTLCTLPIGYIYHLPGQVGDLHVVGKGAAGLGLGRPVGRSGSPLSTAGTGSSVVHPPFVLNPSSNDNVPASASPLLCPLNFPLSPPFPARNASSCPWDPTAAASCLHRLAAPVASSCRTNPPSSLESPSKDASPTVPGPPPPLYRRICLRNGRNGGCFGRHQPGAKAAGA